MAEGDAEFIAAQTSDNVALAQVLDQGLGDMFDDGVASRVAKPIIDLLESIQVDKDHAKRRTIALGQRYLARQFTLERAAIEDRAQGVTIGQPGGGIELLFQPRAVFPQAQDFTGQGFDRSTLADRQVLSVEPNRGEQVTPRPAPLFITAIHGGFVERLRHPASVTELAREAQRLSG